MAEQVVGRRAEERVVTEFLECVPRGAVALVIEGDPGIGKTTLWFDAVDLAAARGFRTLSCRAASAESVLAYTVLADLLGDVDDSIWADLPPPQQQALGGALLRRRMDAHNIDPRAVAAAFVTVIGRLATESPVVIAVDDLQWMDTSSANVVSYAARRLPAGAALLCTTRAERVAAALQLPSPDAVRRIRLQPLAIGELHRVVVARLGRSLARPTLLRIHEISGGNPFFALELVRELGAHGRAFELGLPSSLTDLVGSRIRRVGAPDVLLAMASLPDPSVPVVARATDSTPEEVVRSLGEAENEAVVAIDGHQLRFTHPILAHGVYSAAPPQRRREMHARLAELVAEPELRARHLALADTSGQPATVAALDAAAEIARNRGAPAAAAELLELAFGLGADAVERQILCALCYLEASDPTRARLMLENTIEQCGPGPLRANALNMLGLVRLVNDDFAEAAALLERALVDAADHDALQSTILVMLSYALFNGDQLQAAVERAEQAVAAATRLADTPLLGQALGMRIMMRFLTGAGIDDESLRRAVELEGGDVSIPIPFRPSAQRALLLDWSGRHAEARNGLLRLRRTCVERGDEAALSFIDFNAVLNSIWRGRLDEAATIAEESVERAGQLGGDVPLAAAVTSRAVVAAYCGNEQLARSDAAAGLAGFERANSFRLREWAFTALGFLEVSLGNYQAAIDAVRPLLSRLDPGTNATEIVQATFVPDAVEAMIGVGRFDDAEPLIDALERNGRRLDRPWMLATGARSRAMLQARLGDVKAATATAELAMAEHERLAMPFERARTQLLLGQLQRRQRRRDATPTLREALRTFQQLGTTVWAGRAEAELARGGSGRRREQGLTATEERVAELAASGMINRDIAAALFVSTKTVEVNLSRAYRKLNIRSRAELYQALQVWRSESDMSR
ncbi:LuxR family transcriptional regulator [Mycobacterium sp. UM_CSW]|uniref:AAA family ATPase n=1 Tax=Mycobacterium sp. UM_CSW TaxID=1370119 RepID=UPI00082DB882|nr:LuxR family transcriptional regulator [Mycobacterium sp. UM_CSW]